MTFELDPNKLAQLEGYEQTKLHDEPANPYEKGSENFNDFEYGRKKAFIDGVSRSQQPS